MARRLAAIMFTDLEGFTADTHANEPVSLRALEELDTLSGPIFASHRGRRVKTMGDGLLVEFSNALDAVEAATELQARVYDHNQASLAHPLRLRVGVHIGDVEARDEDILGDAVNIASRLEGLAEPGGVCVSEPVYLQVHNRVRYRFESLGPKELKGISEPIGTFRIDFPWLGESPATSASRVPRLAVLPLANMSPQPGDEFFTDGMTDELISALSKITGLAVISRTSVMQYKGGSKRLADIARDLRVGTVIEGSVRKAGNRIRISVQLIDAVNDSHLWSETYDRSFSDVFDVQSEIAESVASALRVQVVAEARQRLSKPSTRDVLAHQLFLKGRAQWTRRTEETFMAALGYYDQAIQRDPEFALAYADMAHVQHYLGFFELVSAEQAYPKVLQLAQKAVALDPSLGEAHLALAEGLRDTGNTPAVLPEIERALHLAPSSALAHIAAARHFTFTGEFPRAIVEARLALDLDPLSQDTGNQVGAWLMYSGEPAAATEVFRRLTESFPLDVYARDNLGLSLVRQGRFDEGLPHLLKAVELSAGSAPAVNADLIYALSRAGRRDEARQVLERLLQYHEETGLGSTATASGFASLGEKGSALAWLEKAHQEHSGALQFAHMDFAFAELEGDPEFDEFFQRIGIPREVLGRRLGRVRLSGAVRSPEGGAVDGKER